MTCNFPSCIRESRVVRFGVDFARPPLALNQVTATPSRDGSIENRHRNKTKKYTRNKKTRDHEQPSKITNGKQTWAGKDGRPRNGQGMRGEINARATPRRAKKWKTLSHQTTSVSKTSREAAYARSKKKTKKTNVSRTTRTSSAAHPPSLSFVEAPKITVPKPPRISDARRVQRGQERPQRIADRHHPSLSGNGKKAAHPP